MHSRILCSALVSALGLIASPLAPRLAPVTLATVTGDGACTRAVATTGSSLTAEWALVETGPTLYWQSVTFAPTVCQLVAFGGSDPSRGTSANTWLFDPIAGRWTTIAATKAGPPGRTHGAFAWDGTLKRAILFGGRTSGGRGVLPSVLQDTWSFDPATRTWTPLITSCRRSVCPPARWGGMMAWSSAIGKLVLFGGSSDLAGGDRLLNDVWTYDTAWHRVSAMAGPMPRLLFGMAEDAATGMIVVYGGAGAGLRTTRETWLLDPRTWTWTHVPTLATPTADAEVGMAWLPSLNAVVVTGGSTGNGTGVANSTWVFDRASPSWRVVQTNAPVPSMHLESTLTTDSCHGFAIFLGPPDQVFPPTHADYTWILK